VSAADNRKVLIIPCSGIGKAFGSIGREATYVVTEDMRPEDTETICLSLLTMGDEQAVDRVHRHPVITIDGCPKACAEVNVKGVGGRSAANLKVADIYREHPDLKVQAVLDLGEPGRRLAAFLAEKVAAEVDALKDKEDEAHG
jgi:uncharacterized metal-binding protein